jgi:bifunctional diaminopimelate decarboxylase / aspartate kinase
MKFGGTSVSSSDTWATIATEVQARIDEGLRPLVVCSALSGVSNALESMLDGAAEQDPEPGLAALRARHLEMANELGVSADGIEPHLGLVERLIRGVSLVGEASPRTRARVMARGELMSTHLGAAYLASRGVGARWVDARQHLTVTAQPQATDHRRYLSATCDASPDAELAQRLAAIDASALITQGFIARTPAGHTALLGRGGSDTTAAYFAGRLLAVRCEIWTDVPGLYTANPHRIPTARLLRNLDYDEAQEIASTGAKVLHPRCIHPLRAQRIPLHVRCTPHPAEEGTVVSAAGDGTARVKSVSTKTGITLVSMDTDGMWQTVGFLADVFSVFKANGLSIDLVSTSEMNVTVSLDPGANALDPRTLEGLLRDLSTLCRARVIGPCAAVSLVGRRIRALLHRLGPALEAFQEQRVHLVSQAASDLNLTFVVDEAQAERLAQKLHQLLFSGDADGSWLGPTWQERFAPEVVTTEAPRWWRGRREELLAAGHQSPVYVYNLPTIRRRADGLASLSNVDRVFYAMKANANPDVLRTVYDAGLSFECVSPGEIALLRELFVDLSPDRVLFTPNFAPRSEYAEALQLGVHITLDNLHPIRAWPELFADQAVIVRVDPGIGKGHHHYVHTAGAESKFGVWPEELEELSRLCAAAGARVVGLHAHAGSGIRTPEHWAGTGAFLSSMLDQFPDVSVLNLGGGLGVTEKPGQHPLSLQQVDEHLAKLRAVRPGISIWLEPGRYVVAEAGVLLCRVTQRKTKGGVGYVGVDAGMHTLIRPALYGAYHHIVNLSRLDEPATERVHVVGPICESGDTLGYARHLPKCEEDDVLLIDTAGAYGRVMSSTYNQRPVPNEVALT